ncbi:hypothetical protein DBR28_12625 [Chryseobacterium sp. HMWF028]|nr:hypothetical protein DBR28_12625 [Chryseobacterium sp. HMWF028]
MNIGEYNTIFSSIKNGILRSKCPVVGISGAYTSGKTIFTEDLANYLNQYGICTQIIHLDDFHRPLSLLEYSSPEDEINVFYNEAFDIDKLLSDVLLPLSKNPQLH